MQWSILVPTKALPTAKTRLLGATTALDDHARLVRAIRRDTCAAVTGASAVVARLILVLDRPDPRAIDVATGPRTPDAITVLTVTQRRPGLNAALADAASDAASCWPGDAVAAIVGDLPALRSADLADALARAEVLERGFVRDVQGTGTTLLTAMPGVALRPAFGSGSAARHGMIAAEIEADPRLRHDVDTPADLRSAVPLGLGPATAAALPRPLHDQHPLGHAGGRANGC